ncbi:hypothetical protein YWS52_35320 [Chitiniphilus shinanonensis]
MVCPGPLSSAEQRTSGAGFRRGLSEGAQRPSFAAADPIVRREGTPKGRVCGAAFSLVRFFWPRKRNEPARTAAEGVNQLRRRRSAFSGVAVQARPAVEGVKHPRRRRSAVKAVVVAVENTGLTTKAAMQLVPRAAPRSRHAARRPRPTAQVSP